MATRATGTYRILTATELGSLSLAQYDLLCALRKLPAGDTLSPPPGRASASWWKTARCLVRKGLAEENGYVLIPIGKRKENA